MKITKEVELKEFTFTSIIDVYEYQAHLLDCGLLYNFKDQPSLALCFEDKETIKYLNTTTAKMLDCCHRLKVCPFAIRELVEHHLG